MQAILCFCVCVCVWGGGGGININYLSDAGRSSGDDDDLAVHGLRVDVSGVQPFAGVDEGQRRPGEGQHHQARRRHHQIQHSVYHIHHQSVSTKTNQKNQ